MCVSTYRGIKRKAIKQSGKKPKTRPRRVFQSEKVLIRNPTLAFNALGFIFFPTGRGKTSLCRRVAGKFEI